MNHTSSLNTQVLLSCGVCKASVHFSAAKYPVFFNSSLSDRIIVAQNWAKTMPLSFNCLSPEHRVSNCTSSYRCRKCRGKHMQATSGSKNAVSPPVTAHLSTSKATLTHPSSDPSRKVLLQSCNACAHGPQGESMVVRMLYDSCSTYSFFIRDKHIWLQHY